MFHLRPQNGLPLESISIFARPLTFDSSAVQFAGVGHVVVVRVVQKRLRRYAAHVQAGATERGVLFDADGLEEKRKRGQ